MTTLKTLKIAIFFSRKKNNAKGMDRNRNKDIKEKLGDPIGNKEILEAE